MSTSESAYADGANFEEMTPEEKEEFFTNIALANPKLTPDAYEFFAFVVGGLVMAVFIAHRDTMQNYIEALSANPIIVKLTAPQKNVVEAGWEYEEQTGQFTPPE